MSGTLHVISNPSSPHGTKVRCVVYETTCGEVIFDGDQITYYDLFEILRQANGMYEDVALHELTDEQMEDWQEHI